MALKLAPKYVQIKLPNHSDRVQCSSCCTYPNKHDPGLIYTTPTSSTSPLECPFQRTPKFFNLRTFYHQNHLNKGHQNAKKLVSQVTSLFRLMQISKRFLQEAREAHTFPSSFMLN